MQDKQLNELLTLAKEEQEAGNMARAALIYETISKYIKAKNSGAPQYYIDYLIEFIKSGAT